jgi:RNA polymerase sigma factor (sigma-70 family)
MLRSREEAEDAVQHTFLSAFRALRRDVEPVMPKPWLYAIARNCCLTMLRARRPPAPGPARRPPDPAERIELHESVSELLGDVAELPDDQRTALMLSEMGELSHAEIAQVLGCDRVKVKSLVFRARGTLKEARDARDTPCETIREQLATLRGGSLRRGELRHHLRACPSCSEFRWQLARERKGVAALTPVPAWLALKDFLRHLGPKLGTDGGANLVGLGAMVERVGGAQAWLLGIAAGVGIGVGGGSLLAEGERAALGGSTAAPALAVDAPVPALVNTTGPLREVPAMVQPAALRAALLKESGRRSRRAIVLHAATEHPAETSTGTGKHETRARSRSAHPAPPSSARGMGAQRRAASPLQRRAYRVAPGRARPHRAAGQAQRRRDAQEGTRHKPEPAASLPMSPATAPAQPALVDPPTYRARRERQPSD